MDFAPVGDLRDPVEIAALNALSTLDGPWLVRPQSANRLADVLDNFQSGNFRKVEDRWYAQAGLYRFRNIGLIRVHGMIFPRSNGWLSYYFPTCEDIDRSVRMAIEDDSIDTLILDFDSPGGYTSLVPETAKTIYEARSKIKVLAHATHAYSAAYFLASQAQEISVVGSGGVGSIGVIFVHAEYSEMFKENGINVTVLRKPEGKATINEIEPLSDEAKSHLTSQINKIYGVFVNYVSKGRKTSKTTVEKDFGRGYDVDADDALVAGMVDRVEPMSALIARLTQPKKENAVAPENKDNQELAELQAKLAASEAKNAVLAKEAEARDDQIAYDKVRVEVEKYKAIGINLEDTAKALHGLDKSNPQLAATLRGQYDTMLARINANLNGRGTADEDDPENPTISPQERLDFKAQDFAREHKLSLAEAAYRILKTDPKLAQEIADSTQGHLAEWSKGSVEAL